MDFILRCPDSSHVSVDTLHPSLLRSSSFSSPRWCHLQSISSDVFLVSTLHVSKSSHLPLCSGNENSCALYQANGHKCLHYREPDIQITLPMPFVTIIMLLSCNLYAQMLFVEYFSLPSSIPPSFSTHLLSCVHLTASHPTILCVTCLKSK